MNSINLKIKYLLATFTGLLVLIFLYFLAKILVSYFKPENKSIPNPIHYYGVNSWVVENRFNSWYTGYNHTNNVFVYKICKVVNNGFVVFHGWDKPPSFYCDLLKTYESKK